MCKSCPFKNRDENGALNIMNKFLFDPPQLTRGVGRTKQGTYFLQPAIPRNRIDQREWNGISQRDIRDEAARQEKRDKQAVHFEDAQNLLRALQLSLSINLDQYIRRNRVNEEEEEEEEEHDVFVHDDDVVILGTVR